MSAFQYLATPAPQVEPPEAAPVVSPADDTDANEMRAVQPARPSEAAIADAAQEVEPAIVLDAAPRLALEKTKTNKEAHPLSVEALRANGGADFESKVCLDSSQRLCLIGDHDSFSYLHEPPPSSRPRSSRERWIAISFGHSCRWYTSNAISCHLVKWPASSLSREMVFLFLDKTPIQVLSMQFHWTQLWPYQTTQRTRTGTRSRSVRESIPTRHERISSQSC